MGKGYFEVDKKGLAKLLEEKGKQFAVYELIQNAWDTSAKKVDITFKKIPGRPLARIVVTDDDPDGFIDLTHSFTLFAESVKKSDPTKRGRFNLGEKLVLALCTEASVASTKGTVFFNEDGTRRESKAKDCRTKSGSVFTGFIKMNQQEFADVEEMVHTLIPPEGVVTLFNGELLERPEKVGEFSCSLQTVISDEEGNLKRTKRITRVDVYEPRGSIAHIYELGIPVVESGDRYDLDVQQKVPVNMDRDNVPPSYLKALRAHCLNATHDFLTKEEAEETWVTQAMEHKDIGPDAVASTLGQRFGEKRAVFDPNDLEANNRLTGDGYTVISGGTFSKEAWKNVKESGAILPSGVIAPTPKPYGEDGKKDVEVLPPRMERRTSKYFPQRSGPSPCGPVSGSPSGSQRN
jgi:hypothetical protein